MAGYVMKMNSLVLNVNHRGLKNFRSKPAKKAHANRCSALKKDLPNSITICCATTLNPHLNEQI